jgi:hypothetical protein
VPLKPVLYNRGRGRLNVDSDKALVPGGMGVIADRLNGAVS